MGIKRQVFYSFHYELDNWRASKVRNIGAIEGNKLVSDNEWEQIAKGGDNAIKRWIGMQMRYRSCTVVLIGERTAGRKWINYEIIKSWKDGMGVVGIHIHGLLNRDLQVSNKGRNPFVDIKYDEQRRLSQIVHCYDPQGCDSKAKLAWISKYLSPVVERAIQIRQKYK